MLICHMDKSHGDADMFQCIKCVERFQTVLARNTHYYKSCRSKPSWTSCEHCPKKFHSAEELEVHSKVCPESKSEPDKTAVLIPT